MSKRDRLGKGLGALLGEYLDPEAPEAEVRRLPLARIVPNPLQPRQAFTEDELAELAASIEENGLLQPLVVRPSPSVEDRYELVAGERRLRALKQIGWKDAPVLVREASDETLLVLALVENLQREQLSPLEEAEGYRNLGEKFDMTQAEIARAVGKSRSAVANFLRLLNLPPSVRKLLESGQLSMGHARALLSVDDSVRAGRLARAAVDKGWSVREVENRVKEPEKPGRSGRTRGDGRSGASKDPLVQALETALQESLSTRVSIKQSSDGKGRIEITFLGADDFERIFELVTGQSASEVVE